MRFWDTSALVPLLASEPKSSARQRLLRADAVVVVWWGTRVECMAALCRRDRECGSPAGAMDAASRRLNALTDGWIEVLPSEKLRILAERNLRVHALRSADALQLAAAMEAAGGEHRRLPFVCADARLREAAAREGFPALP